MKPRSDLRQPAFVVVLMVTGALFLLLPFFRPVDVPLFFLFVGRLHPLLLHFPIVLIILALIFELAAHFYKLRAGEHTVLILLIAAAASALVSICAGYFLFASGDYAGVLMDRHFWAGVVTGTAVFFTLALFFIARRNNRYYYTYLSLLAFTNLAVGFASHLGGSITHGKDYLTEHWQYILREIKPGSNSGALTVYEDIIVPVFEAKCVSCHNHLKAKGGLLMTSYAELLQGGKSGKPSVTAGRPDESELYARVVLPDDHKDHMPPEGKTPLRDSEISLLKFWLAAGAAEDMTIAEALETDTMKQTVERILPEIARYRRKATLATMKLQSLEAELAALASRLGVVIRRDSLSDEDYFTLAMKFPPAPFTNGQFMELAPYFEVFSKLSLISSGIDDDGLYYIGKMVNVRELYLQKTALDGSGLVYLQQLPHLQILNMSFTAVDDKAAIDLLKLNSLREVYLYRTKTSEQVVEALRQNKPAVKFLLEEGPYF